ncbi:hypothetical protein D3C84_417920 [compost metagenome]
MQATNRNRAGFHQNDQPRVGAAKELDMRGFRTIETRGASYPSPVSPVDVKTCGREADLSGRTGLIPVVQPLLEVLALQGGLAVMPGQGQYVE